MAPHSRRFLWCVVLPAGLALLAAGCAEHAKWVDQILSVTCPVPRDLSDADKKKLLEFSEKVAGMAQQVSGPDLAAQVRQAATSAYGAAEQANRTYALGHAACIACRTNALNVQLCAQAFGDVIKALTPATRGEEPPAVQAANQYSDKLLRGMLPPE